MLRLHVLEKVAFAVSSIFEAFVAGLVKHGEPCGPEDALRVHARGHDVDVRAASILGQPHRAKE